MAFKKMAKDRTQFPISGDGTVPHELITVSDREGDAHYDFSPNDVASVSGEGGCYYFRCRNGLTLEVRWHSERMLRVRYALDGRFESDFSYALSPSFHAEALTSVQLEQTPDAFCLRSSRLRCFIDKKDLRVHLADASGQWLCRERRGFFARQTILRGKIRLAISKERNAEDAYYGLGDKTGPLNLNGSAYENWNTDAFCYGPKTDPLYKTIPFYYGLKDGLAYGIYLDNTYRSRFDFGKTDPEETVFEA
ncbi:alpha-glucosidase domain-containing protein, partial [Arthrospira platensis SPKY1]|nr:alpha-glucosidase domain-containing protein [Arthrospira platensis SPKY1]